MESMIIEFASLAGQLVLRERTLVSRFYPNEQRVPQIREKSPSLIVVKSAPSRSRLGNVLI
jgi:hypothetical protein